MDIIFFKPQKIIPNENFVMTDEIFKDATPVSASSNVDVSNVFEKEITTNPEDIVKTTQSVRVGFLKQMTDHGRKLPNNDDDVKLTLQLMRDMDATAQTSAKLVLEERGAGSAEEIAKLASVFADKLSSLSGGFVRTSAVDEGIVLPEHEFSEEELMQGESPLTADDYIADRN